MSCNEIIIPSSLQPGDTIALVSPSSRVKGEYIDAGAACLQSWGYRVAIGEHAYGAYGNFAGTPGERLADLYAALTDPSVKAVMCTRGGYGAVHLLQSLPPRDIRLNAKWLIGFSDISALHAAWLAAGVASLHAPMCKHLAIEQPSQPSSAYLRAILAGERPSYKVAPHPCNRLGEAHARIVGGNLAVLAGLLRTPYDLFMPGTILFIEDVGERTYKVERMLYNLQLCGVLPHLAGLIVGQFTDYHEDPGMCMTLYEAIYRRVEHYGYPVCFGFPVGHVSLNHPIIEGAQVTLAVSSDGAELRFG